jgi:hypothetical protein
MSFAAFVENFLKTSLQMFGNRQVRFSYGEKNKNMPLNPLGTAHFILRPLSFGPSGSPELQLLRTLYKTGTILSVVFQ